MRNLRFLSLMLASVALAAPALEHPEHVITAAGIRAHVRFLAHDLLEGRGPGTRGDALTQAYIASEFEAMGLQGGAADGGFLQPFQLTSMNAQADTLSVTHGKDKPLAFQYQRDFMANAGMEIPKVDIANAELVFVGYGIVAPGFQWDDFKDVDLKGKVAVVLNNDPEDDPALFGGHTRLYYGRWDYKYDQAAAKGALGVIIIHTTASAGYPWQVVRSSWSGPQFEVPGGEKPRLTLRAWMTEDAVRRTLALSGHDLDALTHAAQQRDFKPVPLDTRLSIAFKNKIEHTQSANVLALLPGTDAARGKQVVLFTAHHDHLGIRPSTTPGADTIYNGAVDNASGVAQLLEVAKAFTALPHPPPRSVLFAAVGGEEQGLLGSQYLADHPPIPIEDLAVDINIDGANIFGRTHDVTVIGLGKTDLDATLAALAKGQGRVLKPDPLPDRGFFYRSDQFSFARKGVPCAYFESGLDYVGRPVGWGKEQREAYEAKHYHQPSDELTDAWNLDGAVEDTRLYFQLGEHVARAAQMPRWSAGDEFEHLRKR